MINNICPNGGIGRRKGLFKLSKTLNYLNYE